MTVPVPFHPVALRHRASLRPPVQRATPAFTNHESPGPRLAKAPGAKTWPNSGHTFSFGPCKDFTLILPPTGSSLTAVAWVLRPVARAARAHGPWS